MTLHPQARAVVAVRRPVRLTDETLATARQALEAETPAVGGPVLPVAEIRRVDVAGVPAILYRPDPTVPAPVLVYLHGGGWTMGSAAAFDATCRRLAVVSGWAVLALDYRLAPEHPYPAAVEDVDAVLAWLRPHGGELGVDGSRIAVGGDSAGGHLATVGARRARDRGQALVAQILVYPALDPTMTSPSYGSMVGYTLDPAEMRYFWDSFLAGASDRNDPDVTPLRAELAGLPPALVLTAEYDVLRDEGEHYAELLADAGVPVTAVRYRGTVHGFFRRLALYDAAGTAVDQVAGYLRGRCLPVGTPVPVEKVMA